MAWAGQGPAARAWSRCRYRPSRAHVAARLPTSSSRPIRPGEHRQHADAAHDARLAHLQSDPVVAVVGVARAHADDARQMHAGAVLDPHRVAAGRVRQRRQHARVVEVTSVNSRGLAGPTLASAVSLPSVARHRPSSLASMVERQTPGLGLGQRQRAGLARRRRQRHLVDGVGHGLPLHREIVAAHQQAQRLLLEVGLLHQPVRQPPQQIDMRAAAFVAARPQPDVVGEKQRDAAFALAREHAAAACRRGPPSPGCPWRRARRPGGTSGSNAAGPGRSLRGRASPDGACRDRRGGRGTACRWCGRSARPAARIRAACARCWSGSRSRGRPRPAPRRPGARSARYCRNRASAARPGARSGRR